MKIIKVTSLKDKKPVYLNVEQIGHFYRVPEKMNYGRAEEVEHTRVGITTHNNGGFSIVETPETLIKLINKAQ
jgi:predicted Zn-dependent protease